jgi:hypothetical protein
VPFESRLGFLAIFPSSPGLIDHCWAGSVSGVTRYLQEKLSEFGRPGWLDVVYIDGIGDFGLDEVAHAFWEQGTPRRRSSS